MTKKKCTCHPDSPFLWRNNPRPSIFLLDVAFRPKKGQVYEHLSPEENVVAYKQFSIYSRANPGVKPSLNKHEL